MAKMMEIPTTAGERWDANVRALRILRELDEDGRSPTDDERAALRRYSGWGDGAYNDAFPPEGEDWRISERGEQLKRIVPAEDWAAIRTSRTNAHYTMPQIIDGMWDVVEGSGLGDVPNPVILEPAAGSGRFIGMAPPTISDDAQWHAVELDTTTGKVLTHSYPEVAVQIKGFEKAAIPNNSVDLAISNVPFGRYGIGTDPTFVGSGVDEGRKVAARRIHNYFFVKSLDKLKPGGIMAFVTSAGTMNAPAAQPFRRYMAERADLIEAIRLPSDAFPDTSVVTDVIFLRKRDPDDESPRNMGWVESARLELPFEDGSANVSVNEYYLRNPDRMLGTPHAQGNMYGDEPLFGLTKNPDFADVFQQSIARATTSAAAASVPQYRERHDAIRREQQAEAQERRQDAGFRPAPGDYFIDGKGRVMEYEQQYDVETTDTIDAKGKSKEVKLYFAVGEPRAVEVKEKDRAARVKGMLSIRDRAKALMERELAPDIDANELDQDRETLKAEYLSFRNQYGPLNAKDNIKAMRRDGSQTFLRSLELCEDIEGCAPPKRGKRADLTDNWQPVDIFERRVHRVESTVDAETVADALAAVRDMAGNRGRIDFDAMGQMLNRSPADVRQELENTGLIFRNPDSGQWEGREEYLSGDVRQKLEDAEALVDAGLSQYEPYVRALREVQPEDVPAGDIYVTPGAAWVTEDMVNQFVREDLLQSRSEFTYEPGGRYSSFRKMDKPYSFFVKDEGDGGWRIGHSLNRKSNVPHDIYYELATPEKGMGDIIKAALEGGIIKVTKVEVDETGKERRVPDADATLVAQQKVDAVVERFREWLWKDPARAAEAAARYNRMMNNIRPRTFDGSHLTFPGMSEEWADQIRSHQKDATYRVMLDGTAMLAHEVGFGKTAVLVAGALERKRLGLTNKPMFVVPKATHRQFAQEAQEIYPNARFLAPQEGDFTPENREAFLSRVRTGDWDGIIVSGDQFSAIPLTSQTEAAWLAQEVDRLRKSLIARNKADDAGNKKPTRKQKDEESRLQEAMARLAALQTERQKMNDAHTERFEKLGVDGLFVDEADRYKNLRYSTAIDGVKGLPNADSLRSRDMYIKTQWLQGRIPGSWGPEQKGEKSDSGFQRDGVVFATGTPIANTVAEVWTMMRYLQGDDLKKRNLENFDEFANTYGVIRTGAEATPQGTYKITNRFVRFRNASDLSRLLQEAWDIRVAREVPDMRKHQPTTRRHKVQAPTYPSLQSFQQSLEERVGSLGQVDPREDNMLKISSEARKASMDIRMAPKWKDSSGDLVEDVMPNPQGKIPMAAVNIAEIYRRETPDKGVQVVFLDMGTPKGSTATNDDELDAEAGKGDDLTTEEQETLKDLYRVIRRRLVAEGVPEDDVAFIHDYPKDEQRQELISKARRGDVRVLLGSTDKMGVGVNVQKRLAALHHLDAPWRPRDIEQREGRIVRQGNLYGPVYETYVDEDGKEKKRIVAPGKGVDIYTYVQAGSFDEFMWQGLEAKSESIAQMMTRNPTARTIEDAGEFTASAAEIRALASGDRRVIDVENLKRDVGNLRSQKRAYLSQLATAGADAAGLEDRVARQEARLPLLQEDAALARTVIAARESAPQNTVMTVGANKYDKSAEGNKALATAMESLPLSMNWKRMGTWYGWNVEALRGDAGYQVALVSPSTGLSYTSTTMNEAEGAAPRLRNALSKVTGEEKALPDRLHENRNMLDRYNKMRGGWPQEDELRRMERQYQCLRFDVYGEGTCPPDDRDAAYVTEDLDRDIDQATYDNLRNGMDDETSLAVDVAGVRDYAGSEALPEVAALPQPVAERTVDASVEPPPVVESVMADGVDDPPEVQLWPGRPLTQGQVPVVLTQREAEPGDEVQYELSGQGLYQDLGGVYTSVVPLGDVNPTDSRPMLARNAEVLLLDKAPVLVSPGVVPVGSPVQFAVEGRTNYGHVQDGPSGRRTFKIEKPRRSRRARAGRIASAR